MNAIKVKKELHKYSNPEKAKTYARFFKSGRGEYGEGDQFIGTSVPEQRKIAQMFIDIPLSEVEKLLQSKIHEHRLTGFFILVYKYKKYSSQQKEVYDFYLKNLEHANNWDLIDCICDKIIGNYLLKKDRKILYKFAESDSLWSKRISIISTFEFIRNRDFIDALKISEILLPDNHDLIHKAVGWMLREIGKRDKKALVDFLDKNIKKMSRTTLRYAIEHFQDHERKSYLEK